jgi:YVTN family beta-propeller protein
MQRFKRNAALLGLLVGLPMLVTACAQNGDKVAGEAMNAPPQTASAALGTSVVYTGDEGGNSISALDLATGQVTTTPVKIAPHNVQASRDGRLLLAVGGNAGHADGEGAGHEHGHGGGERGRLLILDAAKPDTWNASGVEVGSAPAHVVMDKAGQRAYLTNGGDNTLSVVDIAQQKVISTIPTGAAPHGLRLSPDGRELYVANTGGGSVSVINVASGKEEKRIAVGKAPVQVGFTPDGRRVYVSLRDENRVVVLDTAQRKKVAAVPVGRNPIQLFATPNGREMYVANQGSAANPANTVSVIDTATNRVTATIVTDKGAHGVVVSDDGQRAFITNTFADTVSVIDTATHKVLRSVKVGKAPGGVTFSSRTQ